MLSEIADRAVRLPFPTFLEPGQRPEVVRSAKSNQLKDQEKQSI
jgi:hypothetical protein